MNSISTKISNLEPSATEEANNAVKRIQREEIKELSL